MNNKEIKKRLENAITNVETELKNVEQLTKQKNIELAKAWRKFMTAHLLDIEKWTTDWLKDHITKYTKDSIAKGIKDYEAMFKLLKMKEEHKVSAAAYNKAQLEKERLLKTQAIKDKKALEEHIALIDTTRVARSAFTIQIQKEKNEDTPDDDKIAKLEKDRSLEGKLLKKYKRQKPTYVKAAGVTERKQQELFSNRVADVIADLKEDKKTVEDFEKAIASLKMPKVA
jgi:hypothetical protein